MKIYSADIPIWATVYVRAPDEASAVAIINGLKGEGLEFGRRDQQIADGIHVSGRQLNDPNLPAVSLSPAMTIGEPAATENNLTEQD